MSEVVKSYVSSELKTTLTCPKCAKSKLADVSKFMLIDTKARLKCKCSCGHQFTVLLERRRSQRKNVSLPGWLRYKGNKYKIKINDISKHGIRIQLFEGHFLKPGITITVEFTIDDPMNSVVTRDVRVKRELGKNEVGCEFLTFDHSGALGKYYLFYF